MVLNGLDLFSGIGGITLALREWVRPVAYCEIDTYCQAVLLSRMVNGDLPCAPIWDDIRSLEADTLPAIDIIYGGFPCQDISCAGRGAGLEGERSGLFFEIVRLLRELRPRFCFLENVPAITVRGGWRVVGELAALGYDCRWGVLSAYDVGAPHIRERWWLLAHSSGGRHDGAQQSLADAEGERCPRPRGTRDGIGLSEHGNQENGRWWSSEPDVGRVADGISAELDALERCFCDPACTPKTAEPFVQAALQKTARVGRLRCLGNAVVPQCAQEAFRRLAGL